MSTGNTEKWIPSRNRWLILSPMVIGAFLFMLNETIANVALPYMAGSFSISHDESIWILTSYLVSSSIFISCVDFFSKLMGRKNFIILCMLIFAISSFLCGISNSVGMIVLSRIIQGIGGGPLFPITQSIILELFDEEERAVPVALFGFVVVLAPILGPVLGGWLTLNWSWSWVFYINIPFGLLACFLGYKFLEDPSYAQKQPNVHLDKLGFVSLTLFVATLQIVLDKGNNADWFAAPWVCWLSFISVTSLIIFVLHQLRAQNPLCDLRVFKDKNFTIGTFMQFVIQAILLASMALLPQFLQLLMGYDSLQSGLAMMPRGIGAVFGLFCYAIFSNKIDDRILVFIGLMALGIGSLDLTKVNLSISTVSIAIPNFFYGIGMSLAIVPLIALSCNTLSNSQMTNASGLQNLVKNIGGAVGTSIAATMLSRFAQVHQYYLVEHLSPLNNIFIEKVNLLTLKFLPYTDISTANYMAHTVLYKQLLQQSSLKSFVSVFTVFAIASFIIIPLLIFLSNNKTSHT